MRRISLRVGLSVFASATLLGGGAAASALQVAPEEQCQLSAVLDAADGTQDAEAPAAAVKDKDHVASCAETAAEEDAAQYSAAEAQAPNPATQATMFGGISLALVSASAAFAGIDWTPILIKLGSMF
ncbi:hypothetical protein [Corynebacterium sp. LaCa116]|uniref:hypothetical protein n=1 Tax=Corynebacterium sp. LaCa116 TaxID=3391423 RepID=UPI00398A1288